MFSSSQAAINQTVDVSSHLVTSTFNKRGNMGIDEYYKLDHVVNFVKKNKVHRIALQLPDNLLCDSVLISKELTKRLSDNIGSQEEIFKNKDNNAITCNKGDEYIVFILSDNTFGSCCPDEITAAHYDAECIIHFGYACMSKNTRLPVLYVHEHDNYEIRNIIEAIDDWVTSNLNISDGKVYIDKEGQNNNTTENNENYKKPKKSLIIVCCNSANHMRDEFERSVFSFLSSKYRYNLKDSNCNDFIVTFAERMSAENEFQNAIEKSSDEKKYSKKIVIDKSFWKIAGNLIPRILNDEFTYLNSNNKIINNLEQSFLFIGPEESPIPLRLAMILQHNSTCGKTEGILKIVGPIKLDNQATSNNNTQKMSAIMARKVLLTVNKRLQQRMYNIEVLKSAKSIGILVCTLSISLYRETMDILSSIIKKSGKRCYTIYIGHINEFKLANFVDMIDCFCVISCPHSRIANFPEKSDNFIKPLCSPVEVLISLDLIDFSHPYAFNIDFSELFNAIIKGDFQLKKKDNLRDSSYYDQEDNNNGTLICGKTDAGMRLSLRNYQGIEPNIGITPVQEDIIMGKKGIAKGYDVENKDNEQA